MLNKLFLRALFTLSLAFSFTGAANATLISQDILDNGSVVGNVTINIDNATVWDASTSYVANFESFTFFGFQLLDLTDYNLENPLFEASFDHNDISLGLLTLDYDLTDFDGFFGWSGSIVDSSYWSEPSINENYADVWGGPNDVLYYSETLTFGAATVVPTPATLVLFLTAIAGLASRRKKS
ncbi:PEP-CTERM sorting domain-containing protein [Colwellia sp. TT2012]|uniref:PEP-CTERM sorting domain-containing protein n=1 Tax=Colwellia sp. TT2012 TaxID=1720342 RepID=UPI00070B451A|nr:PEP-CTERM sorting domain-containing protein [Colwellia sp. TT2012]